MNPSSKTPLEEKHSFFEHLEELRTTIIKIALTIGVCTFVCFFFARQLIIVYKLPLKHMLESMQALDQLPHILKSFSPTGAFILSLKIALLGAVVISLPIILYFIASFVLPALTVKEKKMLWPAFSIGAVLFFFGIAFCYFVCLPLSLKFLWFTNIRLDIIPLWTIESYISFVNLLLIVFGLAFEIPLLIIVLIKLDLVTIQQLRHYRKHVIVSAFVLSAILTPPDIISQMILSIPLIMLYELCIILGHFIVKK